MRRLPDAGVEWSLPLCASDNAYIRELPRFSHLSKLAWVPDHRKFCAMINGIADRRALRRGDFDIMHITGSNPSLLPLLKKPYVCTVHDLILELFPEKMGDPRKVSRNLAEKRTVIEGASRIIAISGHTRTDLISYYGIAPERIDVIHHGIEIPPLREPETASVQSDPYFLFVGERGGYKNFRVVAEAFAMLADRNPRVHLVCTGRPFSAADEKLIPAAHRNRVSARFVSQSELAHLYSGAVALLAPSRYEGFGMPLIEAGARNCPVILSRCSCYPEIAADGGVYFDADDAAGLADIMERMAGDTKWRESCAEAMLRRARDFSWVRTAELTAQTYRRTLAEIH